MQTFVVDSQSVGERLDIYVTTQLSELSRSSIKTLIKDSKVLVNDKVQPVKYKLKAGDKVKVVFDSKDLQEIPQIALPVIYEDEDCLVVDKPSGLLTHSKGGFNPEATVATFIRDRVKDMDGERAGIVHRLDRGTSGVIICAKTAQALQWLQKQFSGRNVKKQYLAVIKGSIEPTEAIIQGEIARNPKKPKQFKVMTGGKPAETKYKVLKTNGKYSKLLLEPKTGRTHQLRVHLANLNHPIVGDELYLGESFPRLLLHAYSLEVTLPNSERKVFKSEIPKEFEELIDE